jgi:hypothetical protein
MAKDVKNGISHRYRSLDLLRTHLVQNIGACSPHKKAKGEHENA